MMKVTPVEERFENGFDVRWSGLEHKAKEPDPSSFGKKVLLGSGLGRWLLPPKKEAHS